MIYAIFTYRHDAATLSQAVRGIRAIEPSATIAVIDDAGNPLAALPEHVDYYAQSSFDRKRNLNGIECVAGILSTLTGLMDSYRQDRIIKFDSDMILLNPVPWHNEQYIGFEGANWGYGFGGIYGMDRELAGRVHRYVMSRFWPSFQQDNYPEDDVIGRLCMMHTMRWSLSPMNTDAMSGIMALDDDHLREWCQWALGHPESVAMHFGQHIALGHHAMEPGESRRLIAGAMERFNDMYAEARNRNHDQARPQP